MTQSKHKHHLTVKDFSPWFICALGALFYTYEYLLRVTPSLMTKDLSLAFGLTAGGLGNLTAFYYYSYTTMQLPVGLLMDKYGPRRLISSAALLCGLGTLLFSLPHLTTAQMGRFIVGFGSAFAFVGALKLATIWLPNKYIAIISGLLTAFGMIGASGGDVVIEYLLRFCHWRTVLYLTGSFSIILALCFFFLIPENATAARKRRQKTITFKQLLWSLLKIMKDPALWINGLIGCLLFLPLTAFAELWSIPYLTTARGMNPTDAASATALVFIGYAIGGATSGIISDYFKTRLWPLIVGSTLTGITSCILIYTHDLNNPSIYALLFALGAFSSAQVLIFPIAIENCAKRHSGTAIAFTNFCTMLGGVVFQPLIGIRLSWHSRLPTGNMHYSALDYKSSLSILPISLCSALFLSLILQRILRARKSPSK